MLTIPWADRTPYGRWDSVERPCGVGDAEICHFSAGVKYRANVGPVRVGALWRFGGYQLNNGSNSAGQVSSVATSTISVSALFARWHLQLRQGCSSAQSDRRHHQRQWHADRPIPGQTLTAPMSDNQSVMLLAKYTVGGLRLYAGYE